MAVAGWVAVPQECILFPAGLTPRWRPPEWRQRGQSWQVAGVLLRQVLLVAAAGLGRAAEKVRQQKDKWWMQGQAGQCSGWVGKDGQAGK